MTDLSFKSEQDAIEETKQNAERALRERKAISLFKLRDKRLIIEPGGAPYGNSGCVVDMVGNKGIMIIPYGALTSEFIPMELVETVTVVEDGKEIEKQALKGLKGWSSTGRNNAK